jgi:hypothetical protein
VKALDFFTKLHGRGGTISRAALGGSYKGNITPFNVPHMLHYAEVPEWEVWGFYEMKNTIAAILGLSDDGYCCMC